MGNNENLEKKLDETNNDNIDEIEALAAEARKSRPARLSFDTLDVDKLSGQLKQEQGIDAAPEPKKGLDDVGADPFAEPSNGLDNPFEPLSPF